jgi:hypothetical protein
VAALSPAAPAPADLAARETEIALRARELAEQDRLLTEQYRALKMRESLAGAPSVREPATAQPTAAPATKTAPPPRAPALPRTTASPALIATAFRGAEPTVRVHQVPAVEPNRARAGASSFWTRVRRDLFGMGKPVLED